MTSIESERLRRKAERARKAEIRTYRTILHTLEMFIICPLFIFIFCLAYYAGGYIEIKAVSECGFIMFALVGFSIALHIDVEKELYKKLYK
mgnify:CR=1 FL=1